MPQPIRPRLANLRQSDPSELTEAAYQRASSRLDSYLWDQFGIQLTEDRKAPMSNVVVPRIMVMGDRNGDDFPQNINDTSHTPGSRSFFEQVMLGNVFVYPAGKKDPVQLQLDFSDERGVKLAHSVPVEPEQIPPKPVPPLRGFRWFLHKISFGRLFKQRAATVQKAENDHRAAVEKLEDAALGRAATAAAEAAAFEREKLRIKLEPALESAKKAKEAGEKGEQQFLDVFKPTPKKRDDQIKYEEGSPLGANYAYHTESDFRELTILSTDEAGVRQQLREQDDRNYQIIRDKLQNRNLPEEALQKLHPDQRAGKDYEFRSFDQNSVKLGGKPLTDAQFSAVALAACFQSHLTKARAKADTAQYDPTLEDSLKLAGYPAEDAVDIATMNSRSMGATDLFIVPPRGHFIKDYVNKGRLEAADAFEVYKMGKLGPLAKLLANGVNKGACDFNDIDGDHIADQTRGTIFMGKELLDIFEKDSRLKDEALKNYHMDPKKLSAMEGMVKIRDLEQKAQEAEYQIIRAQFNDVPLTKEQKKSYAEQIVMSKLSILQLKEHRKAIEADPNSAYNRMLLDLPQENAPMSEQRPGFPLEKHLRTMPKQKGAIYTDSLNDAIGGVKMLYSPVPKFPCQLSTEKGMESFRNFAKGIVEREGLAELDDAAFYDKLKLSGGSLNLSNALLNAQQAMQPEPQMNAHQVNGPELQQPVVQQESGGIHA